MRFEMEEIMIFSSRTSFALCFGIIMAAVSGCSFFSVETDYDPMVDFSRYHTFTWMPRTGGTPRDSLKVSPLVGKKIQYTVNRVLKAKGYRPAEAGRADFLITFHIGLKDRVEVTDYGYGYGGFRGRSTRFNNYWGAGYYGRDIEVYNFTEMQLVLDFVDSQTNELIWRGVASGVVSNTGADDKRIDAAVSKMLENFPPGP